VIFVEYSVEGWQEKYDGLNPIEVNCSQCHATLICNRPFIEKGYAGFYVEECKCGRNRNHACTRITTNEETASKWKKVLSRWL
jgi:hypothetical protein